MYLVLGKRGYVANVFVKLLSLNYRFTSICRDDFNYYDCKLLANFIIENNISLLINAAGFTGKPNVDACEKSKLNCLQGNTVLPRIIREVCEDLKIPWGHISSGCIYSGRRVDGKGWTEEDEPNFSFRHSVRPNLSGSSFQL